MGRRRPSLPLSSFYFPFPLFSRHTTPGHAAVSQSNTVPGLIQTLNIPNLKAIWKLQSQMRRSNYANHRVWHSLICESRHSWFKLDHLNPPFPLISFLFSLTRILFILPIPPAICATAKTRLCVPACVVSFPSPTPLSSHTHMWQRLAWPLFAYCVHSYIRLQLTSPSFYIFSICPSLCSFSVVFPTGAAHLHYNT